MDSKSLWQKVDLHGLLNASLSIYHSKFTAYSIVDGTLYAIYEEMLTLVELHRIQKKCSVKNNKMQRLGNMNFSLEVSL